MNKANVNLSEKEQMLVNNTDFILTKHQVIKKVYDLFGMLSDQHNASVAPFKNLLPAEVLAIAPKIYKGEQYLLLPYVMMDYPRYYKGEDAFALRHFFWWGHYFSIAVHLAGSYKLHYEATIISNYKNFQENDWFISIKEEPWQHHFEEDNYIRASSLSYKQWQLFIKAHPFIKIAKKIPLNEWENAFDFFTGNFIFLMQIITG